MHIRHFASFSVATLLLSSSLLLAENSGFYGSVGFQYSNMTRAQSLVGPKPNYSSNSNALVLGANTGGSGVTVPQLGSLTTNPAGGGNNTIPVGKP
ncbi:hypothetical protein [Helicobacter mehlei]|uniref:Uncharacterized protein n=1 Tax=Helicobacter mehlei TaxID=2316080 RepID=A0A553US81_9HELI|nr:hypothetical protein [Helicobacter mehlei]TSA83080.1 hypothetical protein FNE76_05330 [Helicobacter mehlei]